MKANKRVRDLKRRSKYRLTVRCDDGATRGTTTYPTAANRVRKELR